jgi:hypothetical protein
MTDSVFKIKKKPFKFLFEIDISENMPKDEYGYDIFYVSSIEQDAFEKYKEINDFFKLPQYIPSNALSIFPYNYKKFICVTEEMLDSPLGFLLCQNEFPSNFNSSKFEENKLKLIYDVDNIYIDKIKKIESFKNSVIFFFFSYEMENYFFKLEFVN